MTIQFPCTGCGNQLSVPAEAAGKQARCPQCSTVLDVPTDFAANALGDDEYQMRPPEATPGLGANTGDAGFGSTPPPKPNTYQDNPYASPTMGYDEPKGGYGTGGVAPSPLEFEAAFSRTWEIFKSQMGIVIGAVLIVGAVNFGLSMFGDAISIALENEEIGPLVVAVFNMGSWLVNTFLGIGQTIVLLNVARGRPARIGEIMEGGPYFLRILGGSIVFGLMVLVGVLLLIIPGIILALMFGQYYMLIIDRNVGVFDAFGMSRQITDGNKMTLLGISLAGGFLAIGVTLVTCGVGILIVGPYLALMSPVIYLMMAGEPIAKA